MMQEKNKLVIETITAFVAVDKDGNEGVLGYQQPDGVWLPLVCADEARVEQMFPMAEAIAFESGMPYRILQFTGRQDITEEIRRRELGKSALNKNKN